MTKKVLLGLALLTHLAVATEAVAQERVVFEGRPLKKIEAGFEGVLETRLTADQSFEFQLRIVERNGKYYWASRGMKELIRSEGGSYVTYHAVDGSGYVRTVGPTMAALMERLPADMRRTEVEYVEHILLQLMSVSYFGNRK